MHYQNTIELSKMHRPAAWNMSCCSKLLRFIYEWFHSNRSTTKRPHSLKFCPNMDKRVNSLNVNYISFRKLLENCAWLHLLLCVNVKLYYNVYKVANFHEFVKIISLINNSFTKTWTFFRKCFFHWNAVNKKKLFMDNTHNYGDVFKARDGSK